MTPEQINSAIILFNNTVFLPGSKDKHFARNMHHLATHSPEKVLSERQAHYLKQLLFKYRRQLPASVVPSQKPENLPPRQLNEQKAAGGIMNELPAVLPLFQGGSRG